MSIETVFFDVGNTLVFMNAERTFAPLLERDIVPTPAQIASAERSARKVLDAYYAVPRPVRTDHNYWDSYYSCLLREIGIDGELGEALKTRLIALARTSSNWSVVLPQTAEILASLRHRYRLAIISNADGHIRDLLEKLGLAAYFETFTDSGNLGFEKPDRRIFEQALGCSSATAARSIYVGDIYSVDYMGARNVGMNSVLIDRAATYERSQAACIKSISELPAYLESLVKH